MKVYALPWLLTALSVGAQEPAEPPEKRRSQTLVFPPGANRPVAGGAAAPAPVATEASGRSVALNALGIDAPGQAAAAFFGLLQRGQVDEAYVGLTKNSVIGTRPEELKTLKEKTREALGLFGEVQGYELIDTSAVGGKLLRRTYLSHGKDFPLRWRFYFYLTREEWRLVDLRVDDRLSGIFGEDPEPPLRGGGP